MASQVRFVIANTAEELTRTVNELLKNPQVQLTGFTRDQQTGRYECLVQYLNGGVPNSEAIDQQLSLEERRAYDRHTAEELLKMYNGLPGKREQVAADMGLTLKGLDDLLRGSA